MDKPYLAHRREDTGEEQLLIDHLRSTAELTGEFGKYIHAEEQAYRCGLISKRQSLNSYVAPLTGCVD